MISVRWNVTYIWTHSSVTRLHCKNRAKTNRREQSPANVEHIAKVCCSCSISLSFYPQLVSFFPHPPSPSVPPLSVLCFFSSTSLVTLHSPEGITGWWDWATATRLGQSSSPMLNTKRYTCPKTWLVLIYQDSKSMWKAKHGIPHLDLPLSSHWRASTLAHIMGMVCHLYRLVWLRLFSFSSIHFKNGRVRNYVGVYFLRLARNS